MNEMGKVLMEKLYNTFKMSMSTKCKIGNIHLQIMTNCQKPKSRPTKTSAKFS
jgi:hypothetical protein